MASQPGLPIHTMEMEVTVQESHGGVRVIPSCHQMGMEWTDRRMMRAVLWTAKYVASGRAT